MIGLTNGRLEARRAAAVLPVRMALGAAEIYHGRGKLTGQGPEQAGQVFDSIGVKPGKPWAVATGVAEVFAGVSSILGIFTRPAALAVIVTQSVALWKVHAKNGFDFTKGGYEYNLALIAMATGLLLAGPGPVSLHEVAEHLAEGRGPRRLLRRARPGSLVNFVRLIK